MKWTRSEQGAESDQRENYYGGSVEPYGRKYSEFDSPSMEMLFNLAWTYDVLLGHLSRDLSRHNVSVSAFNVLMILHRTGGEGCRLNELSKLLVVSRANVTGLVDSLESRGLVERVAEEGDRRVRVAQITGAGEDLIASILPDYYAEVRRVCSGLSKMDKRELSGLLAKLRTSVRNSSTGRLDERKTRKTR